MINSSGEATLRAGIVGCGRVGFLLEDDRLRPHPCTHAGALAAVPDTRIVAACDINSERLGEFGRRYGVDRLYASYDEMLGAESLDLLVIASWTSTHVPVGLAACRAGVRGILCEKPIAGDLASADELISACRAAGIALVVNHERRFDTRYQQVRDMLRDGAIGELRTIVGNVLCSKWPRQSWKRSPELAGGGPLLHDGTHLVDILRFFAGEVEWVSGDVRVTPDEHDVEVQALAMIRYHSGVSAFLEAGGDRQYFNFEVDLQGSLGRIRIGNGILSLARSGTSRMYSGFEDLLPADFPDPPGASTIGFMGVATELIECVRTGRESVSSGADALAALEIINAIYLSASRDGSRISLPLAERDPAFPRLWRRRRTNPRA